MEASVYISSLLSQDLETTRWLPLKFTEETSGDCEDEGEGAITIERKALHYQLR